MNCKRRYQIIKNSATKSAIENKCAEKTNVKILNTTERVLNKSNNNKVFTMLFLAFLVVLFAVVMGFTYSAFSSSKTATGVISFSLPPNADMSNYNLYINNDTVYAGEMESEGNALTTATRKTFNLILTDASQIDSKSAYVQLELTFIGASSGDFTYNGASGLKFIDKTGAETTVTLNYTSTNTSDDGVVMSFVSSGLVAQFASIFLDKVLCGLQSNIVTSNRLLRIKASTSYNSDFSSASSSTLFVNYSATNAVSVTAPSSGTGYTLGNVKVNGTTADLSSVPNGATLTFDVTVSAGYDGNTPLVQLKNGSTIISELNYASKNGTTYSYSTQVTQSCSVAVTTTANTYTIVFAGNGNTSGSMGSMTCTYGQSYTLISNTFAKSYTITYDYNYSGKANSSVTATYTFNGWSASSGGTYANGASISNLTTTNGASITMTAQWTGGSVTLESPSRSDYTFNGWYKDASGTTRIAGGGELYTPTGDITLYAIWSMNVCCVSGDTLITMADGTTKRADEVQVGDSVMTYNFETGELEASQVLETVERKRYEQVTINFKDGTSIKITNDHILYTSVGWKAYDLEAGIRTYGDSVEVAGAFKINDALFSITKEFDKIIESIEYEEMEISMNFYTFVIEVNHNYFSNNVLSHNFTPCKM